VNRDDIIVAAARSWIGTPYHHQASLKGVGCDCLGLIRGVWREVTGIEAESPPPYSPDWAEARGEETMLEAARRHLVEMTGDWRQFIGPGDVLLFRLRRGALVKHAAIHTGGARMIHAYTGRAVVEVHMGEWWHRRLAAAFRFPGLDREDGREAAVAPRGAL